MARLGILDWTSLTEGCVTVGDIVSADAGGMPIYRVVAVDDGRAILQDLQRETTQTLPLDRFHWKAVAA